MTMSSIVDLHLKGEQIGCPVCGSPIKVTVDGDRHGAWCEVDRGHLFWVPQSASFSVEMDARLDAIRRRDNESE